MSPLPLEERQTFLQAGPPSIQCGVPVVARRAGLVSGRAGVRPASLHPSRASLARGQTLWPQELLTV